MLLQKLRYKKKHSFIEFINDMLDFVNFFFTLFSSLRIKNKNLQQMQHYLFMTNTTSFKH